jgi:GDPmannose 4,6-dehydratase
LFLGNLSSKRDWGHAKDYIRAMYLILQQDQPEDFVIATGITTEIREFVRMAFEEVGIEIAFKGSGANETGIIKDCHDPRYQLDKGKEVLAVDSRYFRPTEVDLLIGDASKARTKLKWEPEYTLKGLVKDMIESDIKLMHKEVYLKNGGYQPLNYFE